MFGSSFPPRVLLVLFMFGPKSSSRVRLVKVREGVNREGRRSTYFSRVYARTSIEEIDIARVFEHAALLRYAMRTGVRTVHRSAGLRTVISSVNVASGREKEREKERERDSFRIPLNTASSRQSNEFPIMPDAVGRITG